MLAWRGGPLSRLRRWYWTLSLKWKFFVWLAFICALVGSFGGGIFGAGNSSGNITGIIANVVQNQSGIVLLGHVYNIDIPTRQAQITWLIIGCGDLQLPYTMSYQLQNCGRLLNITNFYVDGSLAPNATYDPLENPVDIENGVASIVYLQAINEFQTTHLLEVSAWHGLDQQYAYPFDTYFLDTSIVALDSDAQKSFHIISLKPVDSTNNFFPYVVTDGPAWLRDSSGAEQFEGRYLRMTFRRTILTQFFIVALFSVNWGLTLVVVLITIWANDGNEVNDSILVLPLSVILTIPALRALWVGAPGFGLLLDSCGIFLQMIIVAICSIFLVMRVGLSSKKERELRKRRRQKYHRDVEEEDIPISDIEWMETHGLKRASAVLSTPQKNSA